ncbi:S8 family serine peptidase [Archangium lansingense]|uniref:S8 family serine peptidase n=1 Tax=Archangium lansingense TaxID=2995310 RepID=A0ABT4AQA0_9BACT|nr:S8 family serine peptidase [Archangium lansinium]MCY1083344.1 S8 family serine peptidase [Archangium lansinium]
MRMSKKTTVLLTCLTLTGCSAQEAAQEVAREPSISLGSTSKFMKTAEPIAGQYIVVLKGGEPQVEEPPSEPSGLPLPVPDTGDEAPVEGKAAAAAAEEEPPLDEESQKVIMRAKELTERYGGTLERTYTQVLRGFVTRMSEDQARKLAEVEPDVSYVVEDGEVTADWTQTGATWGLDRVDQRDRPLNGWYSYNRTGAGVHAYIVDTGIMANHQDFGGRASGDFSSINDGRLANDCNGHGTHVAGTVGGFNWGVAKGVRLHGVRVLDCSGRGSWSGVIAGLDWVKARHIKPAVVNMSLGGGANQAVDDAVRRIHHSGVVVAVAAGNESTNACSRSPARTPEAITVGATNSSDTRPSWSNYGSCLDLFAPGDGITSAWHNGGTNTISGTSMASPHVAGAAALFLEGNPWSGTWAVTDAIVGSASPNRVANAGSGSPNRLLYTGAFNISAPRISLRSVNGNYVVAENGGNNVVNANRWALGPWEMFYLIDLNGGAIAHGDQIALESIYGFFVVAENGGNGVVNANRTVIGPWETFTLLDLNGGFLVNGDPIALRSSSGYYVVAENGGGSVVNANRTAIGPWERFTLNFL